MTTDQTPRDSDQHEARAKLEERASALLQDSAERLDGRTRSRLTQARNAALDAANHGQNIRWLPLGATTAVAVLAVLVTLNSFRQSVDPIVAEIALSPAEEIEIVTAEDSLEFYRDVEFYAWLDSVLEDEPVEPSGV